MFGKKKVLVLLMTVLVVLFGFVLCSCDFGGGSTDTGGTTTKTEEKNKEGWKELDISDIKPAVVYNALLLSGTDLAYQGSQEKLTEKGFASIDAKMQLSIGASSFWISVKGKHKEETAPENTYLSVEMSSAETCTDQTRVIAAYILYDKTAQQQTVFLAVGANNKICFPMPKWLNVFPYEMEQLTDKDISGISALLSANVSLNSAITGEFRRGTAGDEYHYTLDIDLDKTVKNIHEKIIPKLTNPKPIKTFLNDLFGIKNDDLSFIPDGEITIDFKTKNGIIDDFNGNVSVDLSKTDSKLFDGNDLEFSAVLNSIEVKNTSSAYSSLSIPFAKDKTEQEKYVALTDASFFLEFPLTEYESGTEVANETTFKAVAKVFQGDGEEDYLFVEYSDRKNGTILRGMYFYKNNVYLYSDKADNPWIAALYLGDLGDFVYKVLQNNLNGSSAFDVFKMLAYFMRSISFTKKTIKLSITEDFFSDVFFNFDDVFAYCDSLVEENLMEVDGVQEYRDFVSTNQVIVNLNTDVSFLSVFSEENQYITDIYDKLNAVESEEFLTKSSVALELE